MFNIGMPEMILILVVFLVVFGPGKLPEVGRALGKGLGEFRRAMSGEGPVKDGPITIEAKPVEYRPEDKEAAARDAEATKPEEIKRG